MSVYYREVLSVLGLQCVCVLQGSIACAGSPMCLCITGKYCLRWVSNVSEEAVWQWVSHDCRQTDDIGKICDSVLNTSMTTRLDFAGFNRIAIHFRCVGSRMAPGHGSPMLILVSWFILAICLAYFPLNLLLAHVFSLKNTDLFCS